MTTSAELERRRTDAKMMDSLEACVELNDALEDAITAMREICRTSQVYLDALQQIREHHVGLNRQAGRAIERSHTIRLCDAAIAAVGGEAK